MAVIHALSTVVFLMRTSDLAEPGRRPGIGPTASLGRLVLIQQKLGTDMAMTLLDGALSSDLTPSQYERSCHGCSSHQLLVILHEFLTQKIKTLIRILIRLDICRRILRKFSENTRHALSIRCLYMNCQQKQADQEP